MELFRSLRNQRKNLPRQSNLEMLRNRKIVLTGDFFPLNKETFEEKLTRLKGEVQMELNPETNVLICGKFPDWDLIVKAKKADIYTIYIDKVSDLFSISHGSDSSILH